MRYLGGFVALPSASFTIDERSEIVAGKTVAKPVLPGGIPQTYDLAVGRWVPAPRSHVSPDGLRYAYLVYDAEATGNPFGVARIHVVTVSTGQDEVVYSGGDYDIADFAAAGVYLVHHVPQTDGSDGVFYLDLSTRAVKTIVADGYNWKVDGGFGWSHDVAPGDETAPTKAGGDRLLRLDLRAGTVTPVFRKSGFTVAELGVDSDGGVLIEAANEDRQEVWVMAGDSSKQIYSGPGWNLPQFLSFGWESGVSDAHGVWLAVNPYLVYLHPTGGDLIKVATTPLWNIAISGTCR